MPTFGPIRRKDLIHYLRALGFDGPYHGGKHQYPVSAYTFPQNAHIHRVWFDAERMHVELTDERVLSIPLRWIPTLYNAAPEEREKLEINQSRTMIIWNPKKCAINDELRIVDYLGSADQDIH